MLLSDVDAPSAAKRRRNQLRPSPFVFADLMLCFSVGLAEKKKMRHVLVPLTFILSCWMGVVTVTCIDQSEFCTANKTAHTVPHIRFLQQLFVIAVFFSAASGDFLQKFSTSSVETASDKKVRVFSQHHCPPGSQIVTLLKENFEGRLARLSNGRKQTIPRISRTHHLAHTFSAKCVRVARPSRGRSSDRDLIVLQHLLTVFHLDSEQVEGAHRVQISRLSASFFFLYR